jgi:hypothetical protein
MWQGKYFDAPETFCEAGLGEVAFRRPQTNHPKLSVLYVQQKFNWKVVQERRVNDTVWYTVCVSALVHLVVESDYGRD